MKRLRLTFSSRLERGEGPNWELIILDRDTNATYAHQAGFSTRQDAHLASEVVLSCMQAVGAELVNRKEWEVGEGD